MSDKSMTRQQSHLQTLVNRCMVFTDRNGVVLEKKGNRVSASLRMKYEGNGLTIEFDVYSSGTTNGSSNVCVKEDGKIVLDARGNFTVAAFNVIAETYVPGDWEKKIPEKFDR